MLRYNTELAWFSRLIRHPARRWSRSVLTTRSRTGHFRYHTTSC